MSAEKQVISLVAIWFGVILLGVLCMVAGGGPDKGYPFVIPFIIGLLASVFVLQKKPA